MVSTLQKATLGTIIAGTVILGALGLKSYSNYRELTSYDIGNEVMISRSLRDHFDVMQTKERLTNVPSLFKDIKNKVYSHFNNNKAKVYLQDINQLEGLFNTGDVGEFREQAQTLAVKYTNLHTQQSEAAKQRGLDPDSDIDTLLFAFMVTFFAAIAYDYRRDLRAYAIADELK